MRRITRSAVIATAAAAVAAASVTLSPTITSAARPIVANDDGAYVRLLGNPADGTVKFQFGWSADTVASNAAGYWIGVYDVTNSHYEWRSDTGPTDLPEEFFRNAAPTAELPNGNYKIVYFVRGTYDPTTNLAEIELPFTVSTSGM